MRVATTDDLQAMADYWNANLEAIGTQWGGDTCNAQIAEDFRKYIESGISVFEEDNCLICGIILGNTLSVIFLWSSGAAKTSAGLRAIWNEAKSRGLVNSNGIVKTDSSLDTWCKGKSFQYDVHSDYGNYNDTIDNFLSKL